MNGDAVIARRVRIDGHVQGVWYRGWTIDQALQRHLAGWVRNRSDGSVEAVFAGPAPIVEEMIAACHQGPPAARVTAVQVESASLPDGAGFRQLATI